MFNFTTVVFDGTSPTFYLKSKLCTVLTTQNTTGNNRITLHDRSTATLQPKILLAEINQLWSQTREGRHYPEQKKMSRSPANSTVTISIFLCCEFERKVT